MNSESRMMMEALQRSMMQASEQPRAYAEGGAVSALPSLRELSNPNFSFTEREFSNPFAPMTQNVPMSVIQGPAYGSMGTDVYDWKAPTAQAAPQPYSTVNMEAAQVYNRRVPTAAATVNVPMPGVATPPPNVPTPGYTPTMPGVTIPAPVDQTQPEILPPGYGADDISTIMPVEPPPPAAPVDTGFTPVTNPLGPTPEEVRRTEAAKELEALKAREAQEKAARDAEAKRISDLQLAERQRQEQLNLISLENARVRDLRLAEEKRLADEKAAAVAPVVEEPPKPKELTLDMYRDQFGTPYGSQYYFNLKNAQRLIGEGSRADISGPQMEQARFLSEQMDKGIFYPENYEPDNSWYAGDSGD
jgi:hypothetical protein